MTTSSFVEGLNRVNLSDVMPCVFIDRSDIMQVNDHRETRTDMMSLSNASFLALSEQTFGGSNIFVYFTRNVRLSCCSCSKILANVLRYRSIQILFVE